MGLRIYQELCIEQVLAHLLIHRSTLAVLPTGTGKTYTAIHLVKYLCEHDFASLSDLPQGRILILVHKEELLDQWAEEVRTVLGLEPAIEKADQYSPESRGEKPRVVITSVQTMSRPARMERFNPHEFGLLLVDEGHHAPAPTWVAVQDWFAANPELRKLLLTATPLRADQLALGNVCESVAYQYGIVDAIADGWLVPVQNRIISVESIDLSTVDSSQGDLVASQLDALLSQKGPLYGMARPTLEIAGDRQGLVFCAGLHQARELTRVLNSLKPCCAHYLCGETETEERRQWVNRFHRGEIQFLVNFGLFLEGFNAPRASVIVMARPTKSLNLYEQVLGRGTRTWPKCVDDLVTAEERKAAIAASPKPHMTMLDFAGNSGRHKIVRAVDVLGGKVGLPVRDYAEKLQKAAEAAAKKAQEDGKPQRAMPDIETLLRRAALELALEQEEEQRLRQFKAQVAYRERDCNPFDEADQAHAPENVQPREPPTEKQIYALMQMGISESFARGLHKKQASALLAKKLAQKKRARRA